MATSVLEVLFALTVAVVRDPASNACPDANALVAGANGSKPGTFTVASDLGDVVVAIERRSDGYRARIRTQDGRERVLDDDDKTCRGLREALPTVLAVMTKNDGGVSPDAVRPFETTKTSDTPTLSEPAKPSEEPKATMRSERPRAAPNDAAPSPRAEEPNGSPLFTLGVGAGAHFGLSRDLGFLMTLDGTFSLGARFAILGRAFFAPPSDLAVGRGQIAIGFGGGEVGLCARVFSTANASVLPCASVQGGVFTANASGFETNSSATRPLLAGSLSVRAEILRPFGLFLQPSLLFVSSAERFSVDGAGVAYDPGHVAGFLTAGVQFSKLR